MSILRFLFIFLSLQWTTSRSQTWIKAGYWYTGSEYPIPNINTALFTHLICAFAYIDPSTHELVLTASDEPYVSTFASTVKKTNPSVKPLLSIFTQNGNFGNDGNSSNFLLMTENPAYRKSFIQSSIKMARLYGFQGLDLYVTTLLRTKGNMTNLGVLFKEWRVALDQEKLILTMAAHYSPELDLVSYPIDSVRKNFDWVHVLSYDYHTSKIDNFTAAHSALYDPSSNVNTDYGIKEWIKRGLPASKLVLGLAYHGYAWTLVDPKHDGIGAPAKGLAMTRDGSVSYDYIRGHMRSYRVNSLYNSTYVINYCRIGSFWIGFDDVEAIRNKVAYAKEKGLLGYNAWQVPNDHNWELSKAAAQEDNRSHRKPLLAITLCTIASFILLLGCITCYLFDPTRRSMLKWEKWIDIIEGIIQGLLYLQEYSRLTIVHRDLKASNILLDADMKPKISDFGIAKSFESNETEASTERIGMMHGDGILGAVPVSETRWGRKLVGDDMETFPSRFRFRGNVSHRFLNVSIGDYHAGKRLYTVPAGVKRV